MLEVIAFRRTPVVVSDAKRMRDLAERAAVQ
jgi:hypothetical protein